MFPILKSETSESALSKTVLCKNLNKKPEKLRNEKIHLVTLAKKRCEAK